MKVKGLRSKNTIVLHPTEGEPISISKDTNELLFLEVSDLLEQGDLDALVDKYMDIKGKIERYSTNLFTVDTTKGEMYLKGDDQPMPELITKKLLELEQAGEDFMPLIRFWKKLKKNPSQASIDQLYGFMVHNGIGLTESGDIVVEKGVSVSKGKLVDTWTGKIDNSIGEVVEMERSKVNADPNQTCSFGLHVGAPQFVRSWYGSKVLIKCTVNPADVVSVPTDYNNTKMRVCKYEVVGYSDKTADDHKPLYKLSDFVTLPSEELKQKFVESMPEPVTDEDDEEAYVDSEEFLDDEWDEDEIEVVDEEVVDAEETEADGYDHYQQLATDTLSEMTGKEILAFVEQETGVKMPYSYKSKKTLVARGSEILAKHLEALDNR